MTLRFFLAMLLACMSVTASGAEPSTGPYVDNGGPAYAVPDRDVPLPEGHKYRVVFEATDYPDQPAGPNRELELVARFLNMHGKNGVPLEDMDLAVVMHGGALISALTNDTYTRLYGTANPNLALLTSLADAGVKFFVCGQSMGFRELDKKDLAEPVKIGLSAMTLLVTLQAEGYALIQ